VWAASTVLLTAAGAASSASAAVPDADAERAIIDQWHAKRLASLTSDTGWLTLAGLFWLKDGKNTFGSARSNAIRLQNTALAPNAGTFVKTGQTIQFVAGKKSGVTHEGKPVTTLDLLPDTAENGPTLLDSGPVSFFVIERGGQYGIRVRDKENPHRKNFRGLEYFPTSTDWVFDAHFEPYQPYKSVKITNILGMQEDMPSPGAVVFSKDGHEWRLDTVLEAPDDKELFVMFADATSGKETYGAGRFMYIEMPTNGTVRLDFNKSYNPPCAFNDFATCPLPPFQNRLTLRVDAGEKSYAGAANHLSSAR
jgi:hypothetical protein